MAIAVDDAQATWDTNPFGADIVEQNHLCSQGDLPEEGIQGDVPRADQASGRAKGGYNCGLSLVGHTVITRATPQGGTTQTGNANMAWAGDCAYVSGPGQLLGEVPAEESQPGWGVAIIDASIPERPTQVGFLRTPGAFASSETIHAVEFGDRSVLVVGEYGNVGKTAVPMDIYDVSTCDKPELLATFEWPENIHNLTISGNGRYVFGTQPLQVLDLDPLFDGRPARFIGNLESAIPFPLVSVGPGADLDDALPEEVREARTGGTASSLAHEAWPNHDGTKLYIGGVTAQFEALTIVDLTAWLASGGAPEVISQTSGRGHSVRTATVDGRDFLIHSEEAVFGLGKSCFPETLNPFAGPAQPYMTEITDEGHPVTLGQFGLEINQPENCLAQLDSGIDASTHYHTVDSETDTHFVMASMWSAGLRIFDIMDPDHPTEVAYFNPADVSADPSNVLIDQAWGHSRYRPETGQIWFATAAGGFWIVELAPQVRGHFWPPAAGGGPALAAEHVSGLPGTRGASRVDPALGTDVAPYYCTLGSVLG